MRTRGSRWWVLGALVACIVGWGNVQAQTSLRGAPTVAESVRLAVGAGRPTEVLVLLDDAPESGAEQLRFPGAAGAPGASPVDEYNARMAFREQQLDSLKAGVLGMVSGADLQVLTRYSVLPVMHLRLDSPAALARLVGHARVRSIDEIEVHTTNLPQSLALIRQPQAAAAGRTGAGTTVAVMDTGVDFARSAFGSCAAPGGACKVAVAVDFAPNDGLRDDSSLHGTNVAATVLGVAPSAQIAALDVFDGQYAYSNALLAAMNWVVAQRATYNIAAVNMSLGGGRYYSARTPTDSFGVAVQAAVNAGVVVVAASGNDTYTDSIGSPAAYSNIVSVGAVYDSNVGSITWRSCPDPVTAADRVTCFSNSASFLTMLAPGALIQAGGVTMGGTSQAAPHVAGAAAVLRAAYPADSTSSLITRLRTGVAVTDHRNGISKPRLDMVLALGASLGQTLSVTRAGAGSGTVSSAPAGISCGSDCSETYPNGTSVTLTASPAVGSVFAGWSGACTGTASTCTVSMTAARAVTATFATAPPVSLTVARSGTGSGAVGSNPAGITCGSDCSEAYPVGTSVTLTATPALGSVFAGWTGACAGTANSCTVSMSAARSVGAVFNAAAPVLLSVGRAGTGSGAVTSAPAGISCGSDCSEAYPVGFSVTLTATASAGSVFAGWSGACSGTASTCTVAMSAARTVTATFNAAPVSLTVLRQGAGSVTSSPAGISCGNTCTAAFAQGSSVTLTATPATGWLFKHWTGACTGSSTSCTVSMTQVRSVTAVFGASAQQAIGQAVEAPGLAWSGLPAAGTAAWSVVNLADAVGGSAARSGVIGDFGVTTVRTVVTGPGLLQYRWRVSSEPGYDFLSFSFNGWEQLGISGNSGWVEQAWLLPAGTHTLSWTYFKDGSVASGSDLGYLDNLRFTAMATAAEAGAATNAPVRRPRTTVPTVTVGGEGERRSYGTVVPK